MNRQALLLYNCFSWRCSARAIRYISLRLISLKEDAAAITIADSQNIFHTTIYSSHFSLTVLHRHAELESLSSVAKMHCISPPTKSSPFGG